MKNIGVLTYHCIPNFGAQLQTLSTVGYLRKCGYNAIVLNWFPLDLEEYYHNRVPEEQFDCQYLFSQENMPVSNLCRSLEELSKEIERLALDGIIIGSDALFDYTPLSLRYNISLRKLKRIPIQITSNHSLPNPFWGSFNDILAQRLPIAGLSISSQNMPYSKLSRNEKKEISRLINNFDALTVRDQWTKDMVENVACRFDVKITPDPVFSLNKNLEMQISKEEICKRFNLPENYVLISFLYSHLSESFVNTIIRQIEERTNSKCVSFPMPDKLKKFDTKHVINHPLSAVEWYYLIKYSNGYVGERMHPIVVSLHNSVPFFCFDQYGTRKVIIPRLLSKYIPGSSKVYDIVSKSGFLGNMCSYETMQNITPEIVVDRFLSFDKNKCSKFAEKMQNAYDAAMNEIMTVFI